MKRNWESSPILRWSTHRHESKSQPVESGCNYTDTKWLMSFLSSLPSRRCHYGSLMYRLWYFGTALVSRLRNQPPLLVSKRGVVISYASVLSGWFKVVRRLSFNEINGWASKLNAIKSPPTPDTPDTVARVPSREKGNARELLESHFNFRLPLRVRWEVDRVDVSLSHYHRENYEPRIKISYSGATFSDCQ